ncbi:PAS domain-containing protein, partial [Mycobacterium tuberculosis]|nr:PAS domain-containing protein [Mycobacterium tuberculosis]
MPNHVWTARPDGELDWLNDRALAYCGLPLAEIAAIGWAGIAHHSDRGGAENEWRRALTAGSVFASEMRLRRRDGSYRWHL